MLRYTEVVEDQTMNMKLQDIKAMGCLGLPIVSLELIGLFKVRP